VVLDNGTLDGAAQGEVEIDQGCNLTGHGAIAANFFTSGTVRLAGGDLAVTGRFVQEMGLTALDGFTLAVTGKYEELGGLVTLGGGTLQASGGVEIDQTATLSGWGAIIANVTNAGVLQVGDGTEPGTIDINGSFTQLANAVVKVFISGCFCPPGGSSLLHVTGVAQLTGQLQVAYLGGYTPSGGDSFTVLHSDSIIAGAFRPIFGWTTIQDEFDLTLVAPYNS
jgi:hypothetical protein